MQTTRSYLAGALALLLIAAVIGVAYSQGLIGASASQAAPAHSIANAQLTSVPVEQPKVGPDPQVPPSRNDDNPHSSMPQTGSPAIQPSIPDAGPNSPAFTEEDARRFAQRLSRGMGKIAVEGSAPRIDSIQFLTTKALKRQLVGASTLQTAGDVLLCYVVYSGDFAVYSPLSTHQRLGFRHAMQVFDAHTGNLLMQSAYDERK